MSSSRALARSASSIIQSDVCAFCHTRQLLPMGHSNFRLPAKAIQPSILRRTYAQRLDVTRLRADVDKRARVGWYKLTKQQRILLLEPDVAEAIYSDFVAHKDRKDYGKQIKQLMTSLSIIFLLDNASLTPYRIQYHV